MTFLSKSVASDCEDGPISSQSTKKVYHEFKPVSTAGARRKARENPSDEDLMGDLDLVTEVNEQYPD